jgi:hypothetical protein
MITTGYPQFIPDAKKFSPSDTLNYSELLLYSPEETSDDKDWAILWN